MHQGTHGLGAPNGLRIISRWLESQQSLDILDIDDIIIIDYQI